MPTLETQRFNPFGGSPTLERPDRLVNDLVKGEFNLGYFDAVQRLAADLGLARMGSVSTKYSDWEVYTRSNHEVPNFQAESTRFNSALGIYKGEGNRANSILRISAESIPSDEFAHDMEVFTKHYIERPGILGFPSRFLSETKWQAGLVMPAAALATAGVYLIRPESGVINAGYVIGTIVEIAGYGLLWHLSEQHARNQISALDQYIAGSGVEQALYREKQHTIKVAIQADIYDTLLQEGRELTPDQFLEIYDQIPVSLKGKREAEVTRELYPHPGFSDVVVENSDTRHWLLGGTRALQGQLPIKA